MRIEKAAYPVYRASKSSRMHGATVTGCSEITAGDQICLSDLLLFVSKALKLDCNGRALPRLAVEADFAAVVLHSVLYDGEPRTGAAGFLTRNPRMKERKKYGLKAARRAPQFSKR